VLQSWLGKFELRSRLSYESVLTITRIATAALWLVVITVVLEIWGVGLGGIRAVAASVATVIGIAFLATWTMVSNVTASFFITIWRPFHLGDTVEVLPENLKGCVIDSNLMFVALRDDGGAIIQIPNNLFFQKMFRVVSGGNRPPLEPSGTRAAFARPGQSA
jgi:small-conductance mechanosensitive channel